MREKLLGRLADFIYKHHKMIVVAALFATAFMAYCASRLELRLNFIELLDPKAPEVKNINYANNNFGGLSLLFVIVDANDVERAKAFADDFADELVKHPDYVSRAFYKIDPEMFMERGLLYLKTDDLKRMADFMASHSNETSETLSDLRIVSLLKKLNDSVAKQLSSGEFKEADAKRVEESFAQIESVIKVATKAVQKGRDARNAAPAEFQQLRNDFLKRLLPKEYQGELDLSNPYRTDPTGKHLLMLVRASKPTDDFQWNTEFMEVVEAVENSLKPKYPDVTVRMTGNMAVMRDEHRIIQRDMKVVTIITFFGVLILFAIGFKGLGPLGMVALTLGMGITTSYGVAYLAIGYLNVITSVFCSIICGMGIDYAILLTSRYSEERQAGYSVQDALRLTMTQTGKGILTGAIATSGAFYAMGVGKFRAAQQMGMIAGNGILSYLVVMMLVLPAIMVWRDIRSGEKTHKKETDPPAMRALAATVKKGWAWILIAGIAIVAFLAYRATKLEFEYDYTNIEAKNLKSMELLKEMPKLFGWDVNYGMVFSHNLNEDRKLAQRLRMLPSISKVQALSDFIPGDQDAKLKIISGIAQSVKNIRAPSAPPDAPISEEEYSVLVAELTRLRAMLSDMETLASLADQSAAEKNIIELADKLDALISAVKAPDSGAVRDALGFMQNKLATDIVEMWSRFKKMTAAKKMEVGDLPSFLRDHFVGRDGVYCIYAFPSNIIWNEYFMEQNVYELKGVSESASGISVIFYSILTQVKHDFLLIGVAAFMVVFIVLILDYRNVYLSVLTLVPLVAGAIMMVGMMHVLGIKLNFINMGVVPMIIGIGIDYGVYMVHRWLFEGRDPNRIDVVVKSTGRGVQYSALTTIVAFGSLMFASYRGLQSMGQVLSLGIGFCLMAAVVGLPSIYYFLAWSKKRIQRK